MDTRVSIIVARNFFKSKWKICADVKRERERERVSATSLHKSREDCNYLVSLPIKNDFSKSDKNNFQVVTWHEIHIFSSVCCFSTTSSIEIHVQLLIHLVLRYFLARDDVSLIRNFHAIKIISLYRFNMWQ